jgi:hypothetical protein
MGGYWLLYAISAAVSAMPAPSKPTGWYAFWFKFLRQMTNATNAAFEQKFHMTLPSVVEQTPTPTPTQVDTTHPQN